MTLELGDVIQGKYRIVRLIGQGGMGAVYEGENTLIARRVAIKVLYGSVAQQQGVVERFQREAQAAGRIGNDHILEVLDMGTLDDGHHFMIMEYLDGETMGDRTKRVGPLSAKQVYPLARQLLTGLAAAHNAGIIHRDLKPDNVFILREKAGQPDFVKIIDFGISKFTQLDQDMKMTATGAVMGTPYFMSPEQAKGSGAADARSDLYAVGVILYKAVTGQVPFDGATFNELLFKIVLSPMPQPRHLVPELDPAFETIIQKAMARAPERRFQTAEEFAQALDAWATHGTSVTVPPLEETGLGGGTSVIEPGGGTQITPAVSGSTEASGTWSNSETDVPQKRSGAGLLIGLGALAVVALAGGAAFMLMGNDDAPPQDAAADDATAAATSTTEQPAPSTAAPEVRPIDEPAPEEPAIDAPAASANADVAKAAADALGSTGGASNAPAPTPVPKAAAPKPVAPRPTPRPSWRPRPAPQPRPQPKPKQAPDFGY